MPGKSLAKDVVTPVRVRRESLMAPSDDILIIRQSAKIPSKVDVIRCICGRNRESEARDRKDWLQCETCSSWSHPSCYKIAQVVVAQEDVHFLCFFYAIRKLMVVQRFIDNEDIHLNEVAQLKEEIATLKEDAEQRVSRLASRIEAREDEIEQLKQILTKLQEIKMNGNDDRIESPESSCGPKYMHEDVGTQSVSTVASRLTSLRREELQKTIPRQQIRKLRERVDQCLIVKSRGRLLPIMAGKKLDS